MNDQRTTNNLSTEYVELRYELRLDCSMDELIERLCTYKNTREKITNDKATCEIAVSNSHLISVTIKSQEKKSLEAAVEQYIVMAGKPAGYSSSGIVINLADDGKGK